MWKSLVIKLGLVIQYLMHQTKVQQLLGLPVFNALFNVQVPHMSISTPPLTKFRFLKGQVVGKQLPPGEGAKDKKKAHMDPAMCTHPETSMMPRGNRLNKWWTCEKCLSRWQRLTQVEVTNVGEEVHHQDLMTFGMYCGDTYQSVAMNHHDYCTWAMKTIAEDPRPSGGLRRFVNYLEELALNETWEADAFYDQELQNSLLTDDMDQDQAL